MYGYKLNRKSLPLQYPLNCYYGLVPYLKQQRYPIELLMVNPLLRGEPFLVLCYQSVSRGSRYGNDSLLHRVFVSGPDTRRPSILSRRNDTCTSTPKLLETVGWLKWIVQVGSDWNHSEKEKVPYSPKLVDSIYYKRSKF